MKLFKFFLLFCLLLLVFSALLLQTPFAQKKIQTYIEKTLSEKIEGELTIGKLKGILPIWCSLERVEYASKEVEATFDNIRLFFSPADLLFGRFSFFRVHIDGASITTLESPKLPSGSFELPSWPTSPLSLVIHSLKIDHLNINSIEGISLSGRGELDQDFSAHCSITMAALPNTVFHTTFNGSHKDQTVTLITHIRSPIKELTTPSLNLWLGGTLDWKNTFFQGSLYGQGLTEPLKSPWKVAGDLSVSRGKILYFSSLAFETEGFSSQGRLQYDARNHELKAEGSLLDNPFSLVSKLKLYQGQLLAPSLMLQFGDNSLKGMLTYTFQDHFLEGEIDVAFNDFSPLAFERPLKGRGGGHISFKRDGIQFRLQGENLEWKDLGVLETTLEGQLVDQVLTFQLQLKEFAIFDPIYEMLPTTYLQLEGKATEKRLNFEGNLWGLGSSPFTLSVDLPIVFSRTPLDVSIDETTVFAIQLKGKGSIDPLLAFLENASLIARGTLDVDLELSGLWKEPEVQGYLIYDRGRIESLTTGALYRGIYVEFEGVGQALQIRHLVAHDFARGDLAGKGEILWDPEKGFPFHFDIYTSRFTLIATDAFRTSVNSEFALSGTIHEMAITGKATIVEAHLSIPDKLPPQIAVIDVSYINPLPTLQPEEEEEKIIAIHWDLEVEAPRNLIIEGRGLTSEWSGNLHITGEQNDLQYKGELNLVQGRFVIVKRSFGLTEGTVRIEGLEPKDIFVDLKGDLELNAITASVDIVGSLDATKLSFSSTPPMSTNQILSWIIFNQDVNELTPLQACRLANVLVSFSGAYSGPKVFENIKEGLGIDVFDITRCDIDTTDLTFQVGKYISQGTFVGVSKSISGEFDSVTVQTRVFRDFFLEADYGGSLNGLTPNGGKLVFKWYRSY